MVRSMAESGRITVRIARSEQDILASKRLRYQVFVEELGADGPGIDHGRRIESDRFDPFVDNLILVDPRRSESKLEHVVGVYRLMPSAAAASGCGFYSQSEFDLSALISSGRSLVELGRSCVHPDYRGGSSMFLLFNGVADYVLGNNIEIMFGVASFHGTDVTQLTNPLSYLHCRHLAPEELRVSAVPQDAGPVKLLPCDQVDRKAALKSIPPLIKSYLRLGGFIGEGVFFDFDFNSTDVFLLVDSKNMAEDRRRRYVKYRGRK